MDLPVPPSMQEALIRQFQAEIAALRAQLAERQQSDEAPPTHADCGATGGGGGMPAQGRGSSAESATAQQPSPAGSQADAEWRARHREGLQLRMQAMSSQASPDPDHHGRPPLPTASCR